MHGLVDFDNEKNIPDVKRILRSTQASSQRMLLKTKLFREPLGEQKCIKRIDQVQADGVSSTDVHKGILECTVAVEDHNRVHYCKLLPNL